MRRVHEEETRGSFKLLQLVTPGPSTHPGPGPGPGPEKPFWQSSASGAAVVLGGILANYVFLGLSVKLLANYKIHSTQTL